MINWVQRKIMLSFVEHFVIDSYYPRIDKQKISSILDLAGLGVNNEELERILTHLLKKFLDTFGYSFDLSIEDNFEFMVLFITLDAMGHFKKSWNSQSNLQAIIQELKSGSRVDISNELWSKSVIFRLMEKRGNLSNDKYAVINASLLVLHEYLSGSRPRNAPIVTLCERYKPAENRAVQMYMHLDGISSGLPFQPLHRDSGGIRLNLANSYVKVQSATKTNPVVYTAPGHGFKVNDAINVAGCSQSGYNLQNAAVTARTEDTFTIGSVDGSAFTTPNWKKESCYASMQPLNDVSAVSESTETNGDVVLQVTSNSHGFEADDLVDVCGVERDGKPSAIENATVISSETDSFKIQFSASDSGAFSCSNAVARLSNNDLHRIVHSNDISRTKQKVWPITDATRTVTTDDDGNVTSNKIEFTYTADATTTPINPSKGDTVSFTGTGDAFIDNSSLTISSVTANTFTIKLNEVDSYQGTGDSSGRLTIGSSAMVHMDFISIKCSTANARGALPQSVVNHCWVKLHDLECIGTEKFDFMSWYNLLSRVEDRSTVGRNARVWYYRQWLLDQVETLEDDASSATKAAHLLTMVEQHTSNFGQTILPPPTIWGANQEYVVGQRVFTGLNYYKCTTGGTTSEIAPTHTSGVSTDKEVTWEFESSVEVVRNAHFAISSISQGATTTYTCTGHTFSVGQEIVIYGCGIDGYNVTKKVTAIATDTFTVDLDSSSLAAPTTDDLATCVAYRYNFVPAEWITPLRSIIGISSDYTWCKRLGVPWYRSQRDNLARPDATCNVTSIAMALERLGFDRTDLVAAIDSALGDYSPTYTSRDEQWEAELRSSDGYLADEFSDAVNEWKQSLRSKKDYLGEKTSAPTENNEGGALKKGALYENTSKEFYRWNGSTWAAAVDSGWRKPLSGQHSLAEVKNEVAPHFRNEGQLEDLLDFLMFLNPDSGTEISNVAAVVRDSRFRRIMKDFSINGDYPVGLTKDLERIAQANSQDTRRDVTTTFGKWEQLCATINDCLNKGGAVILSYRHKGTVARGSTHIVSLQRAENSGLILDDPYGISRVGYLRQQDVTAYHGPEYDGATYSNAYRNRTQNAISAWRISNRRSPNDNEVRGRDSVMLKETVYNALYYLRFIWRPGTGPDDAN